MVEVFKDIPGFPEYQASNLGNIKSLKVTQGKTSRILKPSNNGRGYRQVVLSINKKAKTMKVHRLVMFAFNGVSELMVNHINGIRHDNRLENLEYCDNSYNQIHSVRIGNHSTKHGENSHYSTITEETALSIKSLLSKNVNSKEIEILFGVSKYIISKIKTGKTWKHLPDLTEGK